MNDVAVAAAYQILEESWGPEKARAILLTLAKKGQYAKDNCLSGRVSLTATWHRGKPVEVKSFAEEDVR